MSSPCITSSHPDLPAPLWAADLLTERLRARGGGSGTGTDALVRIVPPADAGAAGLAGRWRERHGRDLDGVEGAYAMGAAGDGAVQIAAGDEQGYTYALLELCEIVEHADEPLVALRTIAEQLERPRNPVRAITRAFTTETVDRDWFHDRDFWDEYLTELASSRINQFSLALGAGNDYLIDRRVEDNYLYFPYPFLLAVGGYDVSVDGLAEQERQMNLATLQHIGRVATRRGIAFGLGLWNHSYRFDPDADTERWPVRGLDGDNHAEYCRDALRELLRQCPDIVRLTLRSHFEGGVPEPTHEFWRVVLSCLPDIDRSVELDLHLKGVGEPLREIVTELEVPVRLSSKYWAEHQSLPYHQSSIRDNERLGGRRARELDQKASGIERASLPPKPTTQRWLPGTGHPNKGTSGTEETSKRSFTRYSYGDYGYDGREWPLVHRVWPGTQRVLLWGDPTMAAAYGRHASFAGADGVEWFEPLSFLGKKNSAVAGAPNGPRRNRDIYTDPQLQAAVGDWRKFRYTYRLLGRAGYDPDTAVEVLTRTQRAALGPAAEPALRALALGSRVLPLTVATHAPSTACNVYWPEIVTPVPVAGRVSQPENPFAGQGWPTSSDFDMIPPYSFGNVSALDPELFSNAVELAEEIRAGSPSGRENPLAVAARMDRMADAIFAAVDEAVALAGDDWTPELVVALADSRILANLARYYAAAQRTAVGYELRDHGAAMLEWAIEQQRTAITAWEEICAAADEVGYVDDLPFGQTEYSRGSWSWRRPFLAADLASLEQALGEASGGGPAGGADPEELVRQWTPVSAPRGEHLAPERLIEGEATRIEWRSDDPRVTGVTLRWRPVNQALAYSSIDLTREGDAWVGQIPAQVPGDPYPLQYHFRVHGDDAAWAWPGLDEDLANQPYVVVHHDPAISWGRGDR
ncbi:hypothetical protein [Pseudactinotalea terrae]|uniref:hypothetical protein n=1 Tax=Pseudactinotalea terrae TaxID=1743262 RepID=UPI0012E18AEB|nr:hypothetical protein [Pseudactinotalea terrae]